LALVPTDAIPFGVISLPAPGFHGRRIQDRLDAASELADRLHGRAVPAVEFDAVEPGPMFIMPPGTKIAIK